MTENKKGQQKFTIENDSDERKEMRNGEQHWTSRGRAAKWGFMKNEGEGERKDWNWL